MVQRIAWTWKIKLKNDWDELWSLLVRTFLFYVLLFSFFFLIVFLGMSSFLLWVQGYILSFLLNCWVLVPNSQILGVLTKYKMQGIWILNKLSFNENDTAWDFCLWRHRLSYVIRKKHRESIILCEFMRGGIKTSLQRLSLTKISNCSSHYLTFVSWIFFPGY